MPKPIILGKFKVRPDYDEDKDLEESIESVRNALEKELICIDGITEASLQIVVMFAMIDCLAQESTNYPEGARKSKEAFLEFVLKYQKQCDYLERVEPVTLYYRVEDLIEERVLIQGFPPEKEISLDSLGYLYAEKVENAMAKEKSEEILRYISKKYGKSFADKLAKEHQLISLMYRMRSKAVHEMSGLGVSTSLDQGGKSAVPYYRDVGQLYVSDDNVVSQDVVELVIPNIFIRNILIDCINGYLESCRKEKRFPFSNNHMTRKHYLSWYDH